MRAELVRADAGDEHLQLTVRHSEPSNPESQPSFRDGQVGLLFTTSGPTDGVDQQPILVIWGPGTTPLARVALRDNLVTTGWTPFRQPQEVR